LKVLIKKIKKYSRKLPPRIQRNGQTFARWNEEISGLRTQRSNFRGLLLVVQAGEGARTPDGNGTNEKGGNVPMWHAACMAGQQDQHGGVFYSLSLTASSPRARWQLSRQLCPPHQAGLCPCAHDRFATEILWIRLSVRPLMGLLMPRRLDSTRSILASEHEEFVQTHRVRKQRAKFTPPQDLNSVRCHETF